MRLNVIVFAIIPVLPLRTHQGMELIKHSFDPLLLGTTVEEVPLLQDLPLSGRLALHQRQPTNFCLVPNCKMYRSWMIKLVDTPAQLPLL